MSTAISALASAEVKLLLRNKTVAFTAMAVPLLMGYLMATELGGDTRPWAVVMPLQLLLVLGFTVYFTVTASITSRREDLYLKRLCSAEPSSFVVLTGILLPVVVLGLLQMILMMVISLALGAPTPHNPVLLVVAVLGGTVLCVAAGIATSAYTSTSEQAQITTLPFFFALFVGAVWISASEEVFPPVLAIPGGAFADLVHRSFTEDAWSTQMVEALPAVALLVAWVVIAGLVARRWFRWEPRS